MFRCNSKLKNPQKKSPNQTKIEKGLGTQEDQSALPKCRLAQMCGLVREPSD